MERNRNEIFHGTYSSVLIAWSITSSGRLAKGKMNEMSISTELYRSILTVSFALQSIAWKHKCAFIRYQKAFMNKVHSLQTGAFSDIL